MIRINLLPFRAAKRKEDVRRQISVFLLSIVFVLSLMGYAYFNLSGRLNRLNDEKAHKTGEMQQFAHVNKQIHEIKEKLEMVRSRLGVIEELELQKQGPVRLLDDIAQAVPPQRLWLDSLQENSGLCTLSGTAKDHETIAAFMTNLEKANTIVFVDLESAQLKSFAQYDKDLVGFTVGCKTYAFKEPPPPDAASGKKPPQRR